MRTRLTLDIERKPKPGPESRAEVQSSQWEEGPPVYNLGSAATESAAQYDYDKPAVGFRRNEEGR